MDGGAHMHELLDELCDAELCAQAQQSKTRVPLRCVNALEIKTDVPGVHTSPS